MAQFPRKSGGFLAFLATTRSQVSNTLMIHTARGNGSINRTVGDFDAHEIIGAEHGFVEHAVFVPKIFGCSTRIEELRDSEQAIKEVCRERKMRQMFVVIAGRVPPSAVGVERTLLGSAV